MKRLLLSLTRRLVSVARSRRVRSNKSDRTNVYERLASPVPTWSPEHRDQWALFLRSATGQALQARLLAVTAEVAVQACGDAFHTAHSAGTAKGWSECRQWLESLSRTSRGNDVSAVHSDEPQTDNQAPRRDELVERYAP